jgi:hypothetical protein
MADESLAPLGRDDTLPAPDVRPAVSDVVIAGDEENIPPDPSELLCGKGEFVLEIGAIDRHVTAADDQIARLGGQEIDEHFPIMMEERTATAEMRIGNLHDA